jgi:transposase-like protein
VRNLTFYDFPAGHRHEIYSTNPFEWLNTELKRRSTVVGIFLKREGCHPAAWGAPAEQPDDHK